MSVWLEIHCDVRKEGPKSADVMTARCHSNRGDSHGFLSTNSESAVRATLRLLSRHAKLSGWVQISGRWCCPGCKEETSP